MERGLSVVRVLILAVALAALPVAAFAADVGSLTVKVENVSPRGGLVSLGLFMEANYSDDDHPTQSHDVEAVSPETVVKISGLKPGLYAIKMMQDINRNGKMDMSWIGLPQEPYGFSNDASVGLSEPSFARTHFRVAAGDNTITIHLTNSDAKTDQSARDPAH